MQGQSGSVVCRQASKHLALLWFRQGRKEAAFGEVAERQTKVIMKFLCTDTFLEITEDSRRFAIDGFFLFVSVRMFTLFKQAVIAKFEALSQLFIDGLTKTTKCCRIAAVWAQT